MVWFSFFFLGGGNILLKFPTSDIHTRTRDTVTICYNVTEQNRKGSDMKENCQQSCGEHQERWNHEKRRVAGRTKVLTSTIFHSPNLVTNWWLGGSWNPSLTSLKVIFLWLIWSTIFWHTHMITHVFIWYYYMNPPSNFSYVKGRTWATVQNASQGSFCTKRRSWDHLFCICIHFVVDSFQILICIL